uniref:Uncharacterized protein n=1 Tax=Sphaerodactylus townsendi TaxID=933632 RepID=A0ACB8EMW1_9SAUR
MKVDGKLFSANPLFHLTTMLNFLLWSHLIPQMCYVSGFNSLVLITLRCRGFYAGAVLLNLTGWKAPPAPSKRRGNVISEDFFSLSVPISPHPLPFSRKYFSW